ncbi:MAG: insulinase family protein [Chitinophagales bacterium]|nr:insulinase family protein [Chitinophagales bacterium]
MQTRIEPGVVPGYVNPLEIWRTNPTQTTNVTTAKIAREFPFYSMPGDPIQARIYKLKNGMTVMLSQNKIEPRLQTYIAVRAGSKNDPKETTGLAHYLEHMMFKGTSNIGAVNWVREKPILDNIAQLYEKHRVEKDPLKKKEIYAQIDKISQNAAQLAIPNEYDKMISSLGAKGTNAYTSNERTVYVNDIPSNELEKWLILESERFHQLVLRLFHTELETVYEEYNMSQDRDGSKVYKELMKALFPTHQYGTQTTIGEGEHLKNPSLNNIMGYFKTYYVPNNIAICISGDIDYDQTILLIDKYFGHYLPSPVPPFIAAKEAPLLTIQRREVMGQEAESITMGYRLPGANTKEITTAKLMLGILYNGQAGLMDLDLIQQQKVLNTYSYVTELTDYSVFGLVADPREGQTLEDCEKLLVQEINKIKNGEFDEWLIKAVINDYRLAKTKSYENNSSRASAFVDAFIKGIDWRLYMTELDRMELLTKKDVVDFAKKYFSDNYVIVYKRQGEDKNIKKVEKPVITPVEANRDIESQFLRAYEPIPSIGTPPEFINFNQKISNQNLKSGVPFSYIKNDLNQLFELYYILDMGSENDKTLSLAINYLPYLGTDKYTPAQLQQEFFKYGLSFNVFTSQDRTYVSLTGLESNLPQGIELFEHILSNVEADETAYKELVEGILKEREDAKSDKNSILNAAMANYARYGELSPYTDRLSENELQKMKPEKLVQKIKSLTGYQHRIFYYGQKPAEEVIQVMEELHKTPAELTAYPAPKEYPELATSSNKVMFVHYDMLQAQVVMMSKDKNFDKTLLPAARAFNEYFGSGLSSIVFQEIRETKALAYSAYASFGTPANFDEAHYVRAAVYTQADKMQQAIEAMQEIMNTMPKAEQQFEQSKEAVVKQIQSERITRSAIFWTYENAKRRNLSYDVRSDIYTATQKMTIDDMQQFFDEHIADRTWSILVLGDRNKIDINYLKTLGEFQELTLEEIFGY